MLKERKQKLIILFGVSGSGKDEASKVLEGLGLETIHPIEDLKRFLETHFNLPEGSADTKIGKLTKLSDKCSFQDLQMALYHLTKDLDIKFSLPYLRKRLTKIVKSNKSVVVRGVRNKHEAECISFFCTTFKAFDLHLVDIKRNNYQALSTDKGQEKIIEYFKPLAKTYKTLYNNSTLREWQNKVKTYYSNL